MPIYPNLPDQDYRAADAVSNSDLKVLSRSPAHYKARRDEQLAGAGKPPTPALLDGRALHCAVLEPMLFMESYCVLPEDTPSRPQERWRNAKSPSIETTQAFKWWDEWNLVNGSRITLTKEKYDHYMGTAASIRSNPAIAPYLDAPGDSELSVFATDPETGMAVKCRLDRRCRLGNLLIGLELKSTEDARPDAFARNAWGYGYYRGEAFYRDVCEAAGEPLDVYLVIAFEKEAPFASKLYELNPADVERGRNQNRDALSLYKHCKETNSYPAYSDEIEVLSAPAWAK